MSKKGRCQIFRRVLCQKTEPRLEDHARTTAVNADMARYQCFSGLFSAISSIPQAYLVEAGVRNCRLPTIWLEDLTMRLQIGALLAIPLMIAAEQGQAVAKPFEPRRDTLVTTCWRLGTQPEQCNTVACRRYTRCSVIAGPLLGQVPRIAADIAIDPDGIAAISSFRLNPHGQTPRVRTLQRDLQVDYRRGPVTVILSGREPKEGIFAPDPVPKVLPPLFREPPSDSIRVSLCLCFVVSIRKLEDGSRGRNCAKYDGVSR